MDSDSSPPRNLTESGITIPSDSENYDANNELSSSPASSSSSPLILYAPPTICGLLRGAAINILLPFVNGLMLGFGELVANECAFRLGWSGTKVRHFHQRTVEVIGTEVDLRGRYFQITGVMVHDGLGRAWRCDLIPLSGGGGMGRSWTCTHRWSNMIRRRHMKRAKVSGTQAILT
jgi:hypothetical protein